jgi:hypothetical protein
MGVYGCVLWGCVGRAEGAAPKAPRRRRRAEGAPIDFFCSSAPYQNAHSTYSGLALLACPQRARFARMSTTGSLRSLSPPSSLRSLSPPDRFAHFLTHTHAQSFMAAQTHYTLPGLPGCHTKPHSKLPYSPTQQQRPEPAAEPATASTSATAAAAAAAAAASLLSS